MESANIVLTEHDIPTVIEAVILHSVGGTPLSPLQIQSVIMSLAVNFKVDLEIIRRVNRDIFLEAITLNEAFTIVLTDWIKRNGEKATLNEVIAKLSQNGVFVDAVEVVLLNVLQPSGSTGNPGPTPSNSVQECALVAHIPSAPLELGEPANWLGTTATPPGFLEKLLLNYAGRTPKDLTNLRGLSKTWRNVIDNGIQDRIDSFLWSWASNSDDNTVGWSRFECLDDKMYLRMFFTSHGIDRFLSYTENCNWNPFINGTVVLRPIEECYHPLYKTLEKFVDRFQENITTVMYHMSSAISEIALARDFLTIFKLRNLRNIILYDPLERPFDYLMVADKMVEMLETYVQPSPQLFPKNLSQLLLFGYSNQRPLSFLPFSKFAPILENLTSLQLPFPSLDRKELIRLPQNLKKLCLHFHFDGIVENLLEATDAYQPPLLTELTVYDDRDFGNDGGNFSKLMKTLDQGQATSLERLSIRPLKLLLSKAVLPYLDTSVIYPKLKKFVLSYVDLGNFLKIFEALLTKFCNLEVLEFEYGKAWFTKGQEYERGQQLFEKFEKLREINFPLVPWRLTRDTPAPEEEVFVLQDP